MKYYRYTQTHEAMSEWGHAMFSALEENMFCTMAYQHMVDADSLILIDDLTDAISSAWQEDLDNGTFYGAEEYLNSITPEEAVASFNPSDIVLSAEAWDNGDMYSWVWNRALEPLEAAGVALQEGAIVFDPEIITTQRSPYAYNA